DFIITASVDGHLKFWKKKHAEGIEFVKHFRCHLYSFAHIAINHNGTLMVTVCTQDKSLKIFDVPNFDMISMFKLTFAPKTAAWIHQGNDVVQALAVSDAESGKILIYDGKGDNSPIHVVEKLHSKPVKVIEYNAMFDCAISI
uniref:PPIase cyclophilin-type domain-containing protein n=1 Tax=Parascaris univalens TaxID=6257 RepID=A0A915AK17_PARUN